MTGSSDLPKQTKAKLEELLLDDTADTEQVISFVKDNCAGCHLTAKQLGMIFERYCGLSCNVDPMYPEQDSVLFTENVSIDDLASVHGDFRTTNGCDWARSNQGYLGSRYNIVRDKNGTRRVYSVRLDGPNKSSLRAKPIRSDIKEAISKQRCAILDTSNPECDHKDGKYDNLNNVDQASQRLEDYQPLSKAANDAKRRHCKECRETGKRYDATRLGYSQAFVLGDETTKVCDGCYWHDPKFFNQEISKSFIKTR